MSDVKGLLSALEKVQKFNCPDTNFERSLEVPYEFIWTEGEIDSIVKALLISKNEFLEKYEKISADNKDDLNKQIEPIRNMGQDNKIIEKK